MKTTARGTLRSGGQREPANIFSAERIDLRWARNKLSNEMTVSPNFFSQMASLQKARKRLDKRPDLICCQVSKRSRADGVQTAIEQLLHFTHPGIERSCTCLLYWL